MTSWRGLRVVVGGAILAAVVWWTGSGPFVHGLRSLDLATLALGSLIAVPTTVACAWRWRLVAGGLGLHVALPGAVVACYRSQFLNATLPGGVLGDVHRGVRHGLATSAVGRALRSVLWERVAGQLVQAALLVVVLALMPSPFRGWVPTALALLVAAAVVVGRSGLVAGRAWPGVVLASLAAVAGHVATYLVAARAVGVTAPVVTLLPLAMVVLVAAGLPLNVAGWGPREGMAAFAFGAAGLGAGQGVATAVAYGAVVTVASLPGALVLLASGGRRRRVTAPAGEGVRTHG